MDQHASLDPSTKDTTVQTSKRLLWRLLMGLSVSLNLSLSACAQTVRFEPATLQVTPGMSFELQVIGEDFASSPDGGGLNIHFNSDYIQVNSVSIDPVWTTQGIGLSTGTIDNLAGTLEGIRFNSFSNVGNSFPIISISLTSIAAAESHLSLADTASNPWSSGGVLIEPVYQSVAVNSISNDISTINVPIPFWATLVLAAALFFSRRYRQGNH